MNKDNRMNWGILAPDTVLSLRRQQDLGLSSSVRHFNDRAVPGLGGMWFPMPVLWSVLAVSIAEDLDLPALPVGNAIEALIMRSAIDGRPDRRVRGARKLKGLEDWSFANLSRRRTYVVQPIRMAMVQPLVALGFVRGSRYGSFRIEVAGQRLLDLPWIAACREMLHHWVKGGKAPAQVGPLAALGPCERLPADARNLIKARLVIGDTEAVARRRNLIALNVGPSLAQLDAALPLPPLSPEHWRDMRAGTSFVDLRNAAIEVLDQLERRLLEMKQANETLRLSPEAAAEVAKPQLARLKALAAEQGSRIDAGEDAASKGFLNEIRTLSAPRLAARLAERDGSAIAWREDWLGLGPAAGEPPAARDPDNDWRPPADEGFAPQLFRLYNLHCLSEELDGKTNPARASAEASEAA